jgi:hypothetical protein
MEEVLSWKFEYHNSEACSLGVMTSTKYVPLFLVVSGCRVNFQRVPGVVGTIGGYSQGFTFESNLRSSLHSTTHHQPFKSS